MYLGEHYAVDLIVGAALTESIRLAAPRFAVPARALVHGLRALQAFAAG